MSRTHFSPEDLERIKAAVATAEGQTSGEIVPYYVERSDDYDESVWRGGVAAGLIALLGEGFHLCIEAIAFLTQAVHFQAQRL